MRYIEKIILMIVVYMLIGIYGLSTAITYLTLSNKPLSILLTSILVILFYILAIIEEQ